MLYNRQERVGLLAGLKVEGFMRQRAKVGSATANRVGQSPCCSHLESCLCADAAGGLEIRLHQSQVNSQHTQLPHTCCTLIKFLILELLLNIFANALC